MRLTVHIERVVVEGSPPSPPATTAFRQAVERALEMELRGMPSAGHPTVGVRDELSAIMPPGDGTSGAAVGTALRRALWPGPSRNNGG